MRLLSRCFAALALGLLCFAVVPHAGAQTSKRTLVAKKNPITRQMEYVDPNSSVLTRSVTTILKPVTTPVKKVKTALFGAELKQVGPVPGFGTRLTQQQIQAPTGAKSKVANGAGRTAALATGVVTTDRVSQSTGRVVKRGVSSVLGVGGSSSNTGSSSN